MYLNKVTIIGNLTRDPELKQLPSGIAVCSFSVATNRIWKDKNGAKQEEVEYHNVVTFSRTAENVAKYMSKGSQLLIEGRLKTRSWEDKETGKKTYRTEVVAENVQFGFSKRDNRSDDQKAGASAEQNGEEIAVEDVPF